MKVTIINALNGTMRVHDADCADVKRENNKYGDLGWTIDADSQHDVLSEIWTDILAEGDYASAEDCDGGSTKFLPCCSTLPAFLEADVVDLAQVPTGVAYLGFGYDAHGNVLHLNGRDADGPWWKTFATAIQAADWTETAPKSGWHRHADGRWTRRAVKHVALAEQTADGLQEPVRFDVDHTPAYAD